MNKKSNRLYGLMLMLIIFSLALAACGGGDETPTDTRGETTPQTETVVEEPTNTPAPTNTPEPTNTPAPTNTPEPTNTPVPTNTPEPSPTPEPAVNFVELQSPSSGITVQYPETWVGQDLFGLVILASSEEMMAADQFADVQGAAMIMTAGPEDELDVSDPTALMTDMLGEFLDNANLTDGPTDVQINGRDAIYATYEGDSNGSPVVGEVYLIEFGSNAAVALGITSVEDAETYMPVFADIVNTLEVSEPVAGDTGTGDTGTGLPPEEGFLLYGDSVSGEIDSDTLPDVWSFIGLEGETIDLVVTPSDELDVVVDIVDESGNSIVGGEVDESFGEEALLGVVIPASGNYYIVLRGFAGGMGSYDLTLTEAGAGAAHDGDVGSLTYGDTVTGEILGGSGEEAWTFTADAGDFIDVTARPIDDEFDLILDVVDGNGRSILPNGEVDLSFDAEYVRNLKVEESGTYAILVRGYEGSTGSYELTLRQPNDGQPGSIIISGDELVDAEDAHFFPFTALEGEIVTMQVQPGSVETDVVVEFWNDDTDEILGEQDLSTGFEELTVEIPETANYYFLVRGFEGSTGPYDFALVGSDFVIFELAYGDTVYGRLGGDIIEYVISLDPGDELVLTAETEDDIDLALEILDFDDNILASANDNMQGEGEQLRYVYDGTESEVFFIRVSDFFDGVGDFTLFVDAGG